MTHTPPNNLSHAAQALIESLDDMAALHGFRHGLRATIAHTEAQADPNNPAHFEALDALAVWHALDALAEAVQNRKGNHDG